MKKYIYFMTAGEQWFESAVSLHNENIATPVLWIGDDVHYKKAKKFFGSTVVKKDLIIRHRPYKIHDIDYDGENVDFFNSPQYLIAKDRCLKMMDRLDLYGMFSRLDRDILLNKLAILALKLIDESKPDFLLVSEIPHDYPKYLIYQICLYLNIPVYKFNTWNLAPLLYLQNVQTETIVKKSKILNKDFDTQIDSLINNYFESMKSNPEDFEFSYMKKQRFSLTYNSRLKNFLLKDIISYLKDIKHNVQMHIKSQYNPINPYRLGFFTRIKIDNKRKINLKKALKNSVESYSLDEPYIYFPLHFEPERTTNPDGDRFHDQILAIISLRKLIPKNILIYVKEHPSQIIVGSKGSRGRSPMFYKLLKNISGVKLISYKENSFKLLNNSIFSATITGSVALESSVIGKKSIVFGSTWYDNCPNIFKWSEDLKYNEIINCKVKTLDEIVDFFKNQKELYAIPAFQNASKMRRFSSFHNQKFMNLQIEGICHLVKEMVKNL
jgi:hypothetical protein